MANFSVCSINGCGNAVLNKAMGLCSMHYQRWRKNGDPLISKCDRQSTGTICSVEGCVEPKLAKGLCNRHYIRWKKGGDPLWLHDRHRRIERWLNAHLDYDGDDCLKWPFPVGDHGRGTATLNGVTMSAPKAMCILAHGEPPTDAHQAAHSCGKGHEGCIHPGHLRWATAVENEADKVEHGTLRKGEDINTAKLTEGDVREIRRLGSQMSGRALADQYGVTPAAISAVLRRKNWKWLE